MTTTEASAALSIRAGNTLLLDARLLERNHCLTVHSGLVRVSASRPEQEALAAQPVTLGFLQAGDQLPLDLLRTTRLHLEALTAAQLVEGCPMEPAAGSRGQPSTSWAAVRASRCKRVVRSRSSGS